MRAPLVETKQDGSIRVADLTPIVMSRSRFGLPEERLVPFKADRYVFDADDRPCALQCASSMGLMENKAPPDSLIRKALESNLVFAIPVFLRSKGQRS